MSDQITPEQATALADMELALQHLRAVVYEHGRRKGWERGYRAAIACFEREMGVRLAEFAEQPTPSVVDAGKMQI